MAHAETPLERGDHVEIALRLIAEDELRTGERPVTDEGGAYHVWDDESGVWTGILDEENKCRVWEFAGCLVEGSKGPYPLKMKAGDGASALQVMQGMTRQRGFFRDDVLAFANRRVVYVAGDELRVEELQPKHGARTIMPVELDDDRWEMDDDALLARYLTSTFPDRNDQARVQEILGAALLGLGTRFKKAWFLVDGPDVDGDGGTGKSQLLELLEGLVPYERRCSVVPQDFSDDYKGARLYGKTLNIVFEAPDTEILREEGIKAIVHGETITRRPIRQDPITFRPSALHVFAANVLPQAPGATGAFWDRWEVLEFSTRFRDTDAAIPDLAQKILTDELHNVVHFAVRGANRLLRRGAYTSSDASADAFKRWRRGADPVSSFVDEWCVLDGTWTASTELYGAYREWCRANGHNPCSINKFGRRMPVRKKRSRVSLYECRLRDRTELHRVECEWEGL